MTDYGYRSITVSAPAGVAGTIQRGSVKRMQHKGQAFSSTLPRDLLLNRVDGVITSITVLGKDGAAIARLEPTAKF